MTAANEYGQIWIDDGNWAMLSVKATEFGTMPPIQVTSHVSAADLSLYLTVEEARAVIAQLETVIAAVPDEVIA